MRWLASTWQKKHGGAIIARPGKALEYLAEAQDPRNVGDSAQSGTTWGEAAGEV